MMGKGCTALILGAFLEGMRSSGAEVRLFYTRKLKINPCHGDFHCWVRHPGTCFQDDDVSTILPHLKEAEVWVFATPLFVDGMSGTMKMLLDRLIPLLLPAVEMQENHCRHPLREGVNSGQVVLVSNCGFWELDNFDPLLVHMKAICRNIGRDFAGALLRPHGPALKTMSDRDLNIESVLGAARDAGRQLLELGEISPDTLKAVSQDLLPRDQYVQRLNERFDVAITRWARKNRWDHSSGERP